MSHTVLPILLVVFLYGWPLLAQAASTPELMLAQLYQPVDTLADYVVTEKFDGIRGYWNGNEMLTRTGNPVALPEWFSEQLPAFPVEGELWLGYGRFSEMSGLVQRDDRNDPLWFEVIFKIFDAPDQSGTYLTRMAWLHEQVAESININIVKGVRVSDQSELDMRLAAIIEAGGEGLMLNLEGATYQSDRTSALLKYKPTFDDEAKVIGYTPGRGKYEGMVGALIVEWKDGRTFRIGSGLTDELRIQPPEAGSWITFAYSGYTSTGLPRFARYLRPYLDL